MRSAWLAVLKVLGNPLVSIGGATVIAAGAIFGAYQLIQVPLAGSYVAAKEDSITAASSVEGVAKNGASTDLSFLRSGQVAAVPAAVGKHVATGAVLVVLAHADLDASLAGALANQEAANAKLAALQAGTRPEQLAINQTTLAQAATALFDASRSAQVNADDAVHNRADQLFSNPRTTSAQIAFPLPDVQLQNTLQAERVALEPVLSSWSTAVSSPSFSSGDPLAAASAAEANLHQVATFLDNMLTAVSETPPSASLSAATLSADETSINTARVNVASALSALTGAETALKSAQGTLTLAQAGATSNDINAAKAAADAAAAAAAAIRVQISQAALVAPFAGTITAVNAHLGQTLSPGAVVVSLTADLGTKESTLIVPASAVFTDGTTNFVYTKGASGKPMKTIITVGIEGQGETEITSGLTPGDQVMTFGTL